ncbi:MAG: hypothetical protein V3R86_03565 [Candidatus Hydrothermarchaeaceae archaeon]
MLSNAIDAKTLADRVRCGRESLEDLWELHFKSVAWTEASEKALRQLEREGLR